MASEQVKNANDGSLIIAKGLDVGTMNLISASQEADGKSTLKVVRDVFLDIEVNPFTKKMLKQQNVEYAEVNGKMYVLGEAAFELANIMNATLRRPMQHGVVQPGDRDALPILGLLVQAVIGEARKKGELCYVSVPADPIDASFNNVYHQNVLTGILKNLGYEPKPIAEGHAVVFAELADQFFTGIGISFGGGMVNVSVSYKTVPCVSFSTSRAGDWIDENVAQVLGIKPNRATALKEKGIDIKNPRSQEEEAVVIYYRNLISYTLTNIKQKFESTADVPQFPDPVDIVCAGGTSMIKGFTEVFKEELEKVQFPIPIRDVKHAADPLHATAKGCLLAALSELED